MVGFGGIPIRRLGREEAVGILRQALAMGVSFFDTAKGYGDSEAMMGEALEGRRSEVVIASKTPSRTKEEAAADVEQSLRRLRTDYIDLYQLHNVSTDEALAQVLGPSGALEALCEAQRAGKIRYIGITSHSRPVALKALRTGRFVTLMLPFNYLEHEAAQEVLPLCRELGVGFICMKPFAGGALNTPVECLKWVLGQDVGVVIPGIGSLQELAEDVPVADMDWRLSEDELAVIRAVAAETGKTFCRRCEYCQPCSNGIPISTVLYSTSLLRRQGPVYMQNGQYERIKAWVESCTECRECEPRCPYNLAIPDLLCQRLADIQTTLRAVGWDV